MKKKVSQTNPKDVNLAGMPEKTAEEAADSAKCLMQFVRTAADPAKYLSSREMTAPFIAAIVFQIRDRTIELNIKYAFGRILLHCKAWSFPAFGPKSPEGGKTGGP